MSLAISALVAYTHNLRAVYPTKIKAEFKITVENKQTFLNIPATVPAEDLAKYKKGATIFIAGEEVIGVLHYAPSQLQVNTKKDFYSAQGVRPILVRDFAGSALNGGFYTIKEVTGNKIELDVAEGEMIEEEFNGVICISQWRETHPEMKAIVAYYTSEQLGSGVIMEKVKNYQYQLSDSKNRVSSLGIPKDLTTPFKHYKKLPNVYQEQVKELIYA